MHPWSEFVLTVALAGGVACATGLNCPATCTATVDGSSWPCRYHSNECKVNATLNPSRIDVVDLNVAVINPYSGGLGELMTMVEPSVAQAIQDIENSAFLPGYRLNAYVSDSKCTAPDAISASLVAMTTAPKKHVVLSDSCSAACEAVNDAIRQFNVLQVGPGCVSVSLSDRDRYPYFTRMAPSLRFNVITLYELFKFLGVHRVGIIYGYRNINNLVKDLFLEMMAVDNAAGTYSWTPLYTQRVESIEDAESAAQMARSKDARINFMALYELEGSMVLCQAYKKNMLTPEFNWFVATGWWNENFILLAANTAESPCTESELHRASFGLIGVDRGPMLNTNVVHSLSGRTLSDLYHDYTVGCEGFGNGKGVCSHQWAGYFYDGMWLIAQVLHNYLIDQNRSFDSLGSSFSLDALYELALHVDFQGQTGRVRLFNSVEPKTSPPSHGDRDGIVLLRQVTGAPAEAFVQLAFRTEEGLDFKRNIQWSSTEMTPCSGATCDFGTYRPKDRSSSCPAGEVWSMEDGCSGCPAGHFASLGMAECQTCSPGTFTATSGEVECSVCLPGTFAPLEKSSSCLQCAEGSYADQMQATECRKCPRGTYAPTKGLSQCIPCPEDRETTFEGASAEAMCVCNFGQRLEGGACIPCLATEICQGGLVVGHRPSMEAWKSTLDAAKSQEALSEKIGKDFFSFALGLSSKSKLELTVGTYEDVLTALINGDQKQNIIAAPNEDVAQKLAASKKIWTLIASLMERMDPHAVDLSLIEDVAEQTTVLRTASEQVAEALATAASAAGAQPHGMLVDLASRQCTLSQEICKSALLLALEASASDASVTTVKSKMWSATTLFAEAQHILFFGIPALGIPELRELCAMHLMREVDYNYHHVEHHVREFYIASSIEETTALAAEAASEISSDCDEFYDSTMKAAKSYSNDTRDCHPLRDMTDREWLALTHGIGRARCGLAEATRHYMQIANNISVQSSKVQVSVLVALEQQIFNNLVHGQKAENMPAPPTQQILERFISAARVWSIFAQGLEEAVHEDYLDKASIQAQLTLTSSMVDDLTEAMALQLQASETAGMNVQLAIMDLTHRQKLAFHELPIQAYEALWKQNSLEEELNATARAFRVLHKQLLMGAPNTTDQIALKQVTNLCIIRDMAKVKMFYHELEVASLRVCRGDTEAASTIDDISRAGIAAMSEAAKALQKYYVEPGQVEMEMMSGAAGPSGICENVTFTSHTLWEDLLLELVRLAHHTFEASIAYSKFTRVALSTFGTVASGDLRASMAELGSVVDDVGLSMERLVMGSPSPHVPVQPTQVYFDHLINELQPSVLAFQDAMMTQDSAAVQTTEDQVYAQTKQLFSAYCQEARDMEVPARHTAIAKHR
ncbi:unnamed protein product [Durusdinium trenchii]|uniref:Uncharacterized protein n=1 Tax=Durusdinium trenchii TaxID=1381693 RepID=A0ABP0R1A9_9DINO